jgi:hypothetical protein
MNEFHGCRRLRFRVVFILACKNPFRVQAFDAIGSTHMTTREARDCAQISPTPSTKLTAKLATLHSRIRETTYSTSFAARALLRRKPAADQSIDLLVDPQHGLVLIEPAPAQIKSCGDLIESVMLLPADEVDAIVRPLSRVIEAFQCSIVYFSGQAAMLHRVAPQESTLAIRDAGLGIRARDFEPTAGL